MTDNQKIDLYSEIVPRVTWKKIRDIFKQICFKEFTDLDFAAYFFRDEINGINLSKNINIKTNLRFFTKEVFLNSENFYGFCTAEKFKEAKSIFNKLIYLKMIKKANNEHFFIISTKGHSLRMQKCLKRIEKNRAINYIQKIILNVDEYNRSEGYFFINAIWAFGSLLRDVDDVGDLDLSVDISRRQAVKNDSEHPLKTINKNEAYQKVRISPYVSLADPMWLSERLREQKLDAKIVWRRIGFSPEKHENWMNILLNLQFLENSSDSLES